MSIFRRLVSLSIFIAFLVGCTSATSTSVVDSITPQYFQSNPTVNFPSTNTVHPSFTPSPNATLNQTQIADDQAATQAVAMLRTEIAGFPRFCTQDYYSPGSGRFSPDGLWLEEMCYSEDDRDLILTLSNRETQVLWKFAYRDYIPPVDFADGGMLVVRWSKDGRYAYFTTFLGGDGGECFFGSRLDSGTGLFRIDLQTGQTKAILPLKDNSVWYSFSLSPTDRRLVYGVHSLDLKVLDLKTGQLINVVHESDFSQGGGYVWSPDGLRFVYSTVMSDYQGERFGYSVRLVDAQSGSEQILLESPRDCFEAKSWTEDNTLILEKNYNEALVEFDLISNKIITEATLTP